MASIAAEQFKKVFNTLTNIKKVIEATKSSIDQATTNEEWEKLGPLVSRMQDLQGRKVSAETALTLLKNPVAVPSSNSDKEKEEITEPNCCVCMVNIANAIAIPCGHLCCCLGCFSELSYRDHNCPICRVAIESIQQVHQSVERSSFKTKSQAVAEPFQSYGITSHDARAALDAAAGNVSDAGRRLFQLANDRTNTASRMMLNDGASASTAGTGETKEHTEVVKTLIYNNGDSYVGTIIEGGENKGTFTCEKNSCIYEGEFQLDKMHGNGTITWSDGENYSGGMKESKKNGHGTYTSVDGEKYVGQWEDNRMHGNGTNTWANGDTYVGQWKDGKQDNGTYTWADGNKYLGHYIDGKKDGIGTMTFASGNKYVGQWKNDQKDGNGTFTFASGSEYVGQFKDDNFHGQGTKTRANGSIVHSGEWYNDQPYI